MTTKQVQELLDFLGFEPGKIDGIWGPKTRNALAAFQRAYGLPESGDADENTCKALRHAVCYGMPETEDNAAETAPAANAEFDGAKYLRADGYYHIPRGVDCQLTKNFRASEIHCQGNGCCTESVISKRVLELAQNIRDEMGKPLAIGTAGGSGYRCPKHNAEVGGAPNSLHMLGEAVDIHAANPSALKTVVLKYLHGGEVGLYSWGCHVGTWDRGYVSQFNG